MRTYHMETAIRRDGTIRLPQEVASQFHEHRVRITVIDVETLQQDRLKIFQDMTTHYQNISDEPDLDIEDIYEQRVQRHDRDTMLA
ncbi:MAG: hypothetical protein JW725_00970 [Candidatus Babeliaceae bacterium]|nr:hypothetical protein [Candidatus Babeliaceae bacterium]